MLLEAMVQRTPIVATRVGALPEIVDDGVTGMLVPSRDSGALAAAVTTLLGGGPRLREMGESGRLRYEQLFTLQRMVSETLDVYDAVVDS